MMFEKNLDVVTESIVSPISSITSSKSGDQKSYEIVLDKAGPRKLSVSKPGILEAPQDAKEGVMACDIEDWSGYDILVDKDGFIRQPISSPREEFLQQKYSRHKKDKGLFSLFCCLRSGLSPPSSITSSENDSEQKNYDVVLDKLALKKLAAIGEVPQRTENTFPVSVMTSMSVHHIEHKEIAAGSSDTTIISLNNENKKPAVKTYQNRSTGSDGRIKDEEEEEEKLKTVMDLMRKVSSTVAARSSKFPTDFRPSGTTVTVACGRSKKGDSDSDSDFKRDHPSRVSFSEPPCNPCDGSCLSHPSHAEQPSTKSNISDQSNIPPEVQELLISLKACPPKKRCAQCPRNRHRVSDSSEMSNEKRSSKDKRNSNSSNRRQARSKKKSSNTSVQSEKKGKKKSSKRDKHKSKDKDHDTDDHTISPPYGLTGEIKICLGGRNKTLIHYPLGDGNTVCEPCDTTSATNIHKAYAADTSNKLVCDGQGSLQNVAICSKSAQANASVDCQQIQAGASRRIDQATSDTINQKEIRLCLCYGNDATIKILGTGNPCETGQPCGPCRTGSTAVLGPNTSQVLTVQAPEVANSAYQLKYVECGEGSQNIQLSSKSVQMQPTESQATGHLGNPEGRPYCFCQGSPPFCYGYLNKFLTGENNPRSQNPSFINQEPERLSQPYDTLSLNSRRSGAQPSLVLGSTNETLPPRKGSMAPSVNSRRTINEPILATIPPSNAGSEFQMSTKLSETQRDEKLIIEDRATQSSNYSKVGSVAQIDPDRGSLRVYKNTGEGTDRGQVEDRGTQPTRSERLYSKRSAFTGPIIEPKSIMKDDRKRSVSDTAIRQPRRSITEGHDNCKCPLKGMKWKIVLDEDSCENTEVYHVAQITGLNNAVGYKFVPKALNRLR